MRRVSIRRFAATVIAAVLLALGAATSAAAQDGVTVTVDATADTVDFGGAQTVGDLPGPDGRTTLREAAIASTNTIGPETIAFAIPTSDPGFDGTGFTIRTGTAVPDLTIGDDATTVDATTQPGGLSIAIQGAGLEPFRRGLRITSSGNTVRGLGVRGYTNGIQIEGADNLITGVAATGNRQGIAVFGGAAMPTGNRVTGNTVSGNAGVGVVISSARASVVDGNRITGNGSSGVFIVNADEVTVTDNVISENGGHGIEFSYEAGWSSGPPDPATRGGIAAGNTITANGAVGILVDAVDRFTITRNAIAGNGRLGIDLTGGTQDAFGVTRNDSGDRDSGANQRLNFPFRLIAVDNGTATVVEGRVDSPDPQSLTIELLASAAPDSSGFGEGESFAGTATPDAKGRFRATLPAGLADAWITATATDSTGNTSEFSEAVQAGTPRK